MACINRTSHAQKKCLWKCVLWVGFEVMISLSTLSCIVSTEASRFCTKYRYWSDCLSYLLMFLFPLTCLGIHPPSFPSVLWYVHVICQHIFINWQKESLLQLTSLPHFRISCTMWVTEFYCMYKFLNFNEQMGKYCPINCTTCSEQTTVSCSGHFNWILPWLQHVTSKRPFW